MLRRSISRRVVLISSLSVGLSASACADEPATLTDAELAELRGLEDGLELHWSFEDRVGDQITDLSGNGRHGTLNGGAFVASPLGEAVSLDGVDDYLALTHLGLRDPALYGGVDGEFTISARVRVTDVDKLNALCFGCGPLSAMYVGSASDPGKLLTALYDQSDGGKLWPQSSTALANDEWRELTLVVDGGGSARYYLDCAADGELASADVGLADFNFSAVGLGSSPDRWFGGEIDRLQVWSRALPEAELAELCEQPSPLEQGLTLHWTFEDRSDEKITDLSGNGHHGTLSGGAFVNSPKGEAVSLDGVDDWISFAGPRDPALYGGVDGDFTISARVRVDELDKFNTLCFGCGPSQNWYLGDEVHGGRALAGLFNQSTNGTLWTTSTPALSEGKWTEVTMVVDGGASVRHYFDCALDTHYPDPEVGLADYGFSTVGLSNNPARWFGGEIDELRVWDRVLSEQDLQGLCDACLKPIHVDIDAPDGGDGLSWATAFNHLQDALDTSLACATPQVWIAEGSYAPAPQLPVATITAPVAIYGGFAGTETSLAQRDIEAHPVRLGADGWQSRVVVIEDTAVSPDTLVRLDGLTISGSEAGAILIDGWYEQYTPGVVLDNLEITNNSADLGAGVLLTGALTFEVNDSHFEGNVASVAGAAVHFVIARAHIDNSTFVANQSPRAVIHNEYSEGTDWSHIEITNSTMTGNLGGAIEGKHVVATNTEFSNNSAERGAAIYALKFGLEAHNCSFTGNQADYGGAIYVDDVNNHWENVEIHASSFSGNSARLGGAILYDGTHDVLDNDEIWIIDSEFSNNAATSGGGGAIWLDYCDSVTLDGTSFVGNTATGGGAGALWIDQGFVAIADTTFIDNSAPYAGAVQVNTGTAELEIRDSRFVANQALDTTGGGLRNLATNVSVINTKFVGNSSAWHGGGVYGRASFIGCTFANNLAGGVGDGLFAPGGPSMTMRNVVAWPDNISAASMILDHSCMPLVTQTHTNIGTVFIAADPFASADLDLDGLTEFYLAPGSDCIDIGGELGELDWASLTTQASQCTDSTPVDAGVHYAPQSAVGPCGGGGGDGDGDGDFGTGDGDGDGDGDGGSDLGTGDGDGDGDGDFGTGDGDSGGGGSGTGDGDGDGDGECSDWTSIKTGAYGLDKVWTDGIDIIAAGRRDIVKLGAGPWIDTEAATADRLLHATYDVWGPAVDDHWLLGHATSYGDGVFHFNGSELGDFVEFPTPGFVHGQWIPTDLAGSGASDVWAAAMADCDIMECTDPDCTCKDAPSALMHYDGVDWQSIAAPALLTHLWTDGSSTWAVGGRDPDEFPWLTPTSGTVASYDGGGWTLWADDLPPLFAVWAINDDDVWVGGLDGTLRHLELGLWSVHDLPTAAKVVEIVGRASDEVWALDDEGQLWSYDGAVWSAWLLIPGAHDFDLLDDGLVVVSEDQGNVVYFVDIASNSYDTLYSRWDFWPWAMVVNDMDDAVASTPAFAKAGLPGSWRWDGASWTATYGASPGFHELVGAVDQGYAARLYSEQDTEPFNPVYTIVDGVVTVLDPPAPNLSVYEAELITLDGQPQLWISGQTTDTKQAFLYARIGDAWIDRQPPGVTEFGRRITQGSHRVFVSFAGSNDRVMRFANEVWANISGPLEGAWVDDLAATGPAALWATQHGQLWFWDGVSWEAAATLWPELADHPDWQDIDAVGSQLWMVSARGVGSESVARWDEQAWEILTTPALLNGFNERHDRLIEAGPDGVFIHDGVRLWRYMPCAP